jgi:hypothetical protein
LTLAGDSASGICSCVDLEQEVVLEYDGVTECWVGNTLFQTCCGTAEVRFCVEEGEPKLRLVSISDCCAGDPPAVYHFVLDCCEECAAFFCGGGPCLCDPGEYPAADGGWPASNLFRVKLECMADCPGYPEPPSEVECTLQCRCICENQFLPNRVKVTVTGFCPELPPGGVEFYAFGDPLFTNPQALWYIDQSGEGWALGGFVECSPYNGLDCECCDPKPCGPTSVRWCQAPSFRGLSLCASWFPVDYACCTYSNQAAEILSCDPFRARIELYGGMFVLDIEDDSGVCPP